MELMDLAEQGKIGTLIVKDHSRLGRNRLVVGQLLEEDFDRLDIALYRHYGQYRHRQGTHRPRSHAGLIQRVACQKIRARKFGMSSEAKECLASPYHQPAIRIYENPENPKEWLVDEPAAKVVRQIFAMCVAGFGPTQIAKKLKAAEVMTPTEYWNSIGRNCSKPPARPFNWCSDTVANILSNRNISAIPSISEVQPNPLRTRKGWKDRRRNGKYSKIPIPPSLMKKPFCLCRSFGNTAADRPKAVLSVCFQACFIVPIAEKSCITV